MMRHILHQRSQQLSMASRHLAILQVLTLSLNHIVYILPAPAAALTAGTSPISIAIELPFSSRQEIAAGEIRVSCIC